MVDGGGWWADGRWAIGRWPMGRRPMADGPSADSRRPSADGRRPSPPQFQFWYAPISNKNRFSIFGSVHLMFVLIFFGYF